MLTFISIWYESLNMHVRAPLKALYSYAGINLYLIKGGDMSSS